MIPFVRASEGGSSGGPRSGPACVLPAGIEALRLIRRHGKSVRHLRFEDGLGGDEPVA
jgi:hypothetical protein